MTNALAARRALPHRLCTLTATAALLLVAACGGGVSTQDPFTPERIIVFGDDLSVIEKAGNADGFRVGAKYSVNTLDASNAANYSCTANPNWAQYLALSYGMGFEECNPYTGVTPRALMFAQGGKTVAGVAAQIDTYQAAGGVFNEGDLLTVQAGMLDIKDAYERYLAGSQSFDGALAQVRAAGIALGERIRRVTDDGGKVLFMTLPDLSLSPWAAARSPSAVLQLVNAFNEKLRVTVPNDGRKVGLVEAQSRTRTLYSNPSTYSLASVTAAVCDAAVMLAVMGSDKLPACVNGARSAGGTLVGDVTDGSTYLWVDEIHIGPRLHADLGSIAFLRARNNPF